MKIKANLILPDTGELMKSVGLNEGGKVQKYIDNFVISKCQPYLPNNGNNHLYQSSINSTKLGNGLVIWNTPDANYLYEGKLMVDPIAKVGSFPIRNGKISFDDKDGPIEKFVSRKGYPKIMDPRQRDLANVRNEKDHWFDRMIDNEMDKLLNGVQNIVNGGKNE